MFREIKGKNYKDDDPNIIAWQRGEDAEADQKMVKIFPQPGESIKNKKYFAVKDYEKALFYNKGALIGVLGGGVYEIEKQARIKGTEIVWCSTSIQELPWGIPVTDGIPTKDGFTVGLNGDLKLRVDDVKTFYKDVVGGRKEWVVQDLKNWIKGLLHTSLRDIFKEYEIAEILEEDRETVIRAVTAKVTDEFQRYGLELESFNVLGFKSPQNAKKVLDQRQETSARQAQLKCDQEASCLARQKEVIARIQSLKKKLQSLQDALVDESIIEEDYQKKKMQIEQFITEAEGELHDLTLES